ncbi:unnamed protein product [Rotaria sp. Silwood2]|nr:unnamed protein product [Rotaria sp. Silwood2]
MTMMLEQKNSQYSTLIVTEGDSAKALAVVGLGLIGRDRYDVYPLKVKILALNYGEKYANRSDLSKLHYRK